MNEPCLVDASIMTWREKLRNNAVRPISAIRHIYKDSNVTAWLQYRGTQTFPGREWSSYLRCDTTTAREPVCGLWHGHMQRSIHMN